MAAITNSGADAIAREVDAASREPAAFSAALEEVGRERERESAETKTRWASHVWSR